MPDDEAGGQVPPGQGETPPNTSAPQDGDDEWSENFDASRARQLIAKLRNEAKQASKALKDVEQLRAEKQQRTDAELSEQQRLQQQVHQLQAERDAARAERQDALNKHAVLDAAHRLGAVDADAVVRLLDWDALSYDEATGHPQDVERAVKALLREKPYLMTSAPGSPAMSLGNGQTRVPPPGQQQIRRSQIADYQWYSRNKEAVMDAFRNGTIIDD